MDCAALGVGPAPAWERGPMKLDRLIRTTLLGQPYQPSQRRFEKDKITALQSASVVVDYVLDIFPVNSVVDIGCGPGFWLKTFADRGVRRIAGIDGGYTDRARLAIDPPVSLAVI
jgi:hypothetical protein